MREFAAFDPSVGSGKIVTNGINKDEQLMLYNDSIYRIRLHFNDKSVGIVPALWNKDYIISTVPMGDITWEVVDSLNIANNPSMEVYGEIYESGEHVASVNASMQRSVVSSIPGGVSTSVVSLESTGANTSPDGTNIITITDSLGNTLVVDNNGLLTLNTKVGAALIQQLKTGIVEPLLQIGANGHTTEVLGALQIDQDLTISNGHIGVSASSDVIDAGNPIATYIKSRSSGSIHFQTPGGTDQVIIDTTGLLLVAGKGWKGATGDYMARTASITNGSGSGTYNHVLGAIPDSCLPHVHQAGSATVGYDTETSTQVHITLGAVLTFNAFLYKRT